MAVRAKKRAKYHAVKVTHDGITFDSKLEAARYLVLKDQQEKGEIFDLQCHVRFPIKVLGTLVCTYISDFVYMKHESPDYGVLNAYRVVEDVKGFVTPVYRLKKKLMKIVHGIDILETH